MVAGRSILEVGALDVNGSLRSIAERFGPSRYVGVDLYEGPGVDRICDAHDLLHEFGAESFDGLISTELLEHVRDWQTVVRNFKRVLKPGGWLLLTTRSAGFPYHGYPLDFWRYERSDLAALFSDFEIETIESDPVAPGVFLAARRPDRWVEKALGGLELHSMILDARVERIGPVRFGWYRFRCWMVESVGRWRP
jgi:SAM-dependent methyltransferase